MLTFCPSTAAAETLVSPPGRTSGVHVNQIARLIVTALLLYTKC